MGIPNTRDAALPLQGSSLLRPHYSALDGVRALAFGLVFLWHYGYLLPHFEGNPIGKCLGSFLDWTWVGVDVFFVVSGFLITGILYDSLTKEKYFSNFYIRRSLRIFPLFYSFWLITILLTPILHIEWNRYVSLMALYLGNFFIAGGNLGLNSAPGLLRFHFANVSQTLLTINTEHFWSLCVEEQFYLAWPAVIWFVRSRKSLLGLCVLIICISPLFRLLWLHLQPQALSSGTLYHSTFTRLDTLLFGAALALWLRGPCPSVRVIHRIAVMAVVGGTAVLLFGVRFITVSGYPHVILNPFVATLGFTMVAVVSSGFLLLTIERDTQLTRLLQARPLVSLGRISYGMYFFHHLPWTFIATWLTRHPHKHLGPVAFLAVAIFTVTSARLSFRFIESPFLRLKSRIAPTPGAVEDPPPAALQTSST